MRGMNFGIVVFEVDFLEKLSIENLLIIRGQFLKMIDLVFLLKV